MEKQSKTTNIMIILQSRKKRTLNTDYNQFFPSWIYHNFCDKSLARNSCAFFFFLPSWALPHIWPLILWVLTLAPCQVHGVCSIYLEFIFFDCEPQSDAAAADCGEVLSTSGLKGNNWFLPTRLEKVNFENPHRPSGRPINGFHLEKKSVKELLVLFTIALN